MSPEEITIIVENAVANNLRLPWWSYFIALMAPFIGGFFGAYVKKKGENLATKKDFDSLLKQLKETTVATEEIKTDIAKGSWLHQQEWHLKEKYYSAVIDALYRFKQSLSERLDHYMEPGSEYNDTDINKSEHFSDQARLGSEALQDLRRLHGAAEIVISARATKALDKFYNDNWHASNFSECNKEYLSDVYVVAKNAHQILLEEARSELVLIHKHRFFRFQLHCDSTKAC